MSAHPRTGDDPMDPRAMEILTIIAGTPGPVGAREIGRRLSTPAQTSESTVNRILRQLDDKGFTSQSGRGRITSSAGRSLVERTRTERRWHDAVEPLQIRTLADARDLLVARRALEREIVRSVARYADIEDIRQLAAYVTEHGRSISSAEKRRATAIDFHRHLVRASANPMLRALAAVLFDPRFDNLERVLDIVTAGAGRTAVTPNEHRDIVDAIAARDADAAEAAMLSHLDHLLEDLEADVSPNTKLAIETLLSNL